MEPKGMYKIDQFAVRLCFQAFIKQGRSMTPITPVNSDVIYDASKSIASYTHSEAGIDSMAVIL